jgi:uncharacterized cupin superfamily protein
MLSFVGMSPLWQRGCEGSAMNRVNIATAECRYDAGDPEGFRSGMARLGPGLGAHGTGMSVYELPPGQAICPYHYEYGEEEWLLVLEGRPTLRHPRGSDWLAPMDVAFFPTGPDGAHEVRNETDETARVAMFSTVVIPAATVYPDSDKIGIWTGNEADDAMVPRSANVPYFHGEPEAPREP